uniref:Uncharacterized protein n=1 Tax=Anguilla anguilla TaxID=7936 RepID=A0A0E9XP25_ANGAN
MISDLSPANSALLAK